MSRIVVAGAGAWGRALAHVAQSAGHNVTLWSRAAPDLQSLQQAEALILAVPAQAVREVLQRLSPVLPPELPVIVSAKGIEQSTGKFMNGVVAEVAPSARGFVLSGPSFAADVMKGLPTAVVLAAPALEQASHWASALTLPSFRIYGSDDVLGVEIGGALKNVLAIACGIVEGRGLGRSAHAALITRGFAELTRFAIALGGRAETVAGLCGLGDLVLTCSSPQSRNMTVGLALGRGQTLEEALAGKTSVAEGVASAPAVRALAAKLGVETPISNAVAAILAGEVGVSEAIIGLLSRPLTTEGRY